MKTSRSVHLGPLELLHDRLILATSHRRGYTVQTLHLDQVHRTAVRFGHNPVLAVLSGLFAIESVFGVDLGHLTQDSERFGLGVAALVLMMLYVLTRSVVVGVSAGPHTVNVRLRGGKARAAEATQFALRIDQAAMQARREIAGSAYRYRAAS